MLAILREYIYRVLQETPGDIHKEPLSAADHTWYSRMWHTNQLPSITFMSQLTKYTFKYYPPHWTHLPSDMRKAHTACSLSFGFWSYKYIQNRHLFCMSAKQDLLISGKRIRIVDVLQVGILDSGCLR
jgi:hypothetical protein